MNKLKSLKDNLYVQLFCQFFQLGLFTIGGGLAMLPLMQDIVVEKKGWMSEEECLDCIAVSQGLPGVVAINMATYIGQQKKGFAGALCATTGVILPSFIIIILIVELLQGIGENSYVQGALTGIKAAVVGLIGCAAYKVGKKVLKGPFQWIMAAGSFAAIGLFGVNAVYMILLGIAAGILYSKGKERHEDGGDEE